MTYEIFDGVDRLGIFETWNEFVASPEAARAPKGAICRRSPMIEDKTCEWRKVAPGRWKTSRIARADPGEGERLMARLC